MHGITWPKKLEFQTEVGFDLVELAILFLFMVYLSKMQNQSTLLFLLHSINHQLYQRASELKRNPVTLEKKRILDYFIHSNIMKDTNWKQCLGFKHYYQIEHQKSTRDSLCWNNHRNVYIVCFWVELDSLQKLTGRWVTKGWIWYILLPKLSKLFSWV